MIEANHQVDLALVKGLVEEAIDSRRLAEGRERQLCVERGEKPDFAPLMLGHPYQALAGTKEIRCYKLGDHHLMVGGAQVPELSDYPHLLFTEQITSPEVMLYEALWDLLSWVRTPDDGQLSVRPNLCFVLGTCFGMEYEVGEDGSAWYSKTVDLDRALDTDLSDLRKMGQVPLVLEHLEFFRENLPAEVHIALPVAIGPINQADAILGATIWEKFYDEPEKMHALMDKITDAIIEFRWLCKDAIRGGNESYIGPLCLSFDCAKIGNDALVMMSPKMYDEFVRPYTNRLCQAFGGGLHHSCGFYAGHLPSICDTPGVKIINFGEPRLWDMEEAVAQIHRSGKLYHGGWYRQAGEPLEDYLRRGLAICGPDRNRATLFAMGEGPWPPPEETMEMWHRLQE
ncbi:MAG: hypothetical protein JXM70_28540 [Pirellulales bacterium]|nr:hypothetical protein [Pirellulales bacterium]